MVNKETADEKSIPSNKPGNINIMFTSRSDHATIVVVEKQ